MIGEWSEDNPCPFCGSTDDFWCMWDDDTDDFWCMWDDDPDDDLEDAPPPCRLASKDPTA